MTDASTSSNEQLEAAWSDFCRDTPVALRGPWEAFKYAYKSRMPSVETSADRATLDEWLRIEARLHAALTRRFGSDAVSAAVAEVCADIRAHNPLIPPVEPPVNSTGF